MLLAPGESTTTRLLLRYADGTALPIALPDDAHLTVSGAAGIGSAAVKDGALKLTAGNTIGTLGITVDAADLDLPAGVADSSVQPFYLQTARLQPGVIPLTNAEIVFPAAGVETLDGMTAAGKAAAFGYTASGIGTFTWDDIMARSSVERTGGDDETDPSLGYILRIPVVLYGDAPAVGTKVAAVEGASVLGTVVGSAQSGEVGGRPAHLVTVELSDVTSILRDYVFDVLGSGIDDADAALPSPPEPATGNDDDTAGGPQGLRAAVGAISTASDTLRRSAASRSSRAPQGSPATATQVRAASLRQEAEESPIKCTFGDVDATVVRLGTALGGSFTTKLAEAKFGIESGGVTTISLVSAVDLTISGSISLDLGVHGEVHPTCTAANVGYDFGALIPAPASLLFTPTTGSSIVLGLDIALDAGAEYHAKATIQDGFSGQLGFRYNGGTDFQGVNTIARKTQNYDLKFTGETPTTSVYPFSLDGKVGVYWQPYAGFVIGGNVVKFLETLNKWGWFSKENQEKLQKLIDAAQIKILKGKVGPFVHAVYQSVGSVLAKESSGNVVSMDATGKLELTAADLLSLLRWAGIGTLSLSITLAQIDFVLAALDRHLDGSPAITVDGVAVGKTAAGALKPVEINPKQEVKITIPVTPAPVAVIGPTPTLGATQNVYESNGVAWVKSDKITFAAAGSQLTTTLKVDSVDECTSTWKDITFAVIPMADSLMVDNWPGWGGKFTVTCAVPELAALYDGAEIGSDELHADDNGQLNVTLKGTALSKAYDYTIASDKTWLTVKPSLRGTIGPSSDTTTAGGEAVTAKPTVDLTFAIDCGELKGEEKAEVTVTPADDRGLLKKITVNVTADCGATLEFDPETATLRPPSQDASPVTVLLKSNAAVERKWEISAIPSWMTMQRADDPTQELLGTFPAGEQQQEFKLTAPVPPACDADGTKKGTVTAKSQVTDTHAGDPHWATTSLTVIFRCQPPKLTVTPASVTVHRNETVTVKVVGSYLAGPLPVTATSALTSNGLTITPASATIQPGSPDSAPLSIGLSCDGSQRGSGQLVITGGGQAPRPDPVSVPVTLRCDTELTLTPSALTGRNATATLHWAVQENKTLLWTMQPLPEWLVASPVVGATTDTGKQESAATGDETINFAVVVTAQECGAPPKTLQATVAVTGYETFPDGGGQVSLGDVSATYTYTQPAGRPCFPVPDGPTAPVGGDPHMGGFNGTRYDAQVIGEYTYLTPTDPSEDGPILQARHEPTYEGSSVTSVTAVALKLDGHVLELYARPHLTIFLDGEQVTLPEATPLMIGDSASIVRVGQTMTISGGGLSVVVSRWPAGSVFNFDVTTRTSWGLPVWGMLGGPTGDQDDDRRRSDGVVEDSLNWFDADGHQAVLRFANSWRITDPAKSLLTHQGSDAFDAMNPAPISLEELATNRALVTPALPTVCAASPSRDRVISELAVELWARGDGDIAAVLSGNAQLLCRYYVAGQVTLVDGETSSSQAGLRVSVSVAGTSGCQTATAGDGSYQCVLTPDPGGTAPEGGPAVQVSVLNPAGGSPIGGSSAVFASAAVMGGAQSITVNVVVPADQLPTAVLSGSLIARDGAAMAGPVSLCIAEQRGDGSFAAARTLTIKPDPATGAYSLTVRLPETPRTLRLTACGNGVYDWGFTSKDVPLTGALTLIPLSFSVAALPAVVVSGNLTKDGRGNTATLTLRLTEYQNGTPVFFQDNLAVHPDPVTGYYRLVLPLYTAPTSVRVSTLAGGLDDWGQPGPWELAVPGGGGLIPLDISFDADTLPIVTITGHIKVDGHGAAPFTVNVLEDVSTSGSTPVWGQSRTLAIAPDPDTGEYTAKLWLLSPPKQLWLVPNYPASLPGWDYNLPRMLGLANAATQTVTLDYDVSRLPALTVQGTLHQLDGSALAGPVMLVIAEQKPDGQLYAHSQYLTVNPAADGSYSAQAPLYVSPVAAVKVWAASPALPGFAQVNAAFLPLTDDGTGNYTVTVNYLPDQGHTVTLTGHLTRDGAGFPGAVTFCVQEQNPSGVFQAYRQVPVTIDPVTGAFTSAALTLLETSYRRVGVAVGCAGSPFQNSFLRFEQALDPDAVSTVVTIEFDDSAKYIQLFDASTIPADLKAGLVRYGYMKDDAINYQLGVGINEFSPALNLKGDPGQFGKQIRVDAQYNGLWYRVEWTDADDQQHEVTGVTPIAAGTPAKLLDPWHQPDANGPVVVQITQPDDEEYRQRCGDDYDENYDWCHAYGSTDMRVYQFHDGQQTARNTAIGTFWQDENTTAAFWLTLRPDTDSVAVRYENGFFDANGVDAAVRGTLPAGGPFPLQVDPPRPGTAGEGTGQIHLFGEWADWQRDLGWQQTLIGVLVPDPDNEHWLKWALTPAFFPLDRPDLWPDEVTGTVDDDGYDLWIELPGEPGYAYLAYLLPDWDFYSQSERLDFDYGDDAEPVQQELPLLDTVKVGGTVYWDDSSGPAYQGDMDLEVRFAPANDVNQDVEWDDMPIEGYIGTVTTDADGHFAVTVGLPHDQEIYRIAVSVGVDTGQHAAGIGTGFGFDIDLGSDPYEIDHGWLTFELHFPVDDYPGGGSAERPAGAPDDPAPDGPGNPQAVLPKQNGDDDPSPDPAG